jgi:hypothetical protein
VFNISRKKTNLRLNKITDQKTVLVIRPSQKSIRSITDKIKTTIKNTNNMAALIKELNPIIRG